MPRMTKLAKFPKPSLDIIEQAAVRANTRKSYESDIRHYRDVHCGLLPALPNHLIDYLYEYSDIFSPDTLARRLAGIASWHSQNGFTDFTKDERVRKVLRGIRHFYGRPISQAYPLILNDIARITDHLNFRLAKPLDNESSADHAEVVRLKRDKAQILYMFWRGLRAHQAVTLDIKYINTKIHDKWEITLPPDKTHDDYYQLDLYKVTKSSIRHLCPILALEDYINFAQIKDGPIFSKIERGGVLSNSSLHPNSLNPWIKKLCEDASVGCPTGYSISSHSPRVGFATTFKSDMSTKDLMDYMGWKSAAIALRYIATIDLEKTMRAITSNEVIFDSRVNHNIKNILKE